MKRIFTLNTSDVSLLITLFAFVFASCSTRVEKEAKDQAGLEITKIAKELPVITVAKLDVPAINAGYFDLIVETSNCLGENIWIGGKLESNAGDTPGENEYEVTQFTATGLNSNLSYALENNEGTIKAVRNKSGAVYLQLQEGLLQLQPATNSGQIVLAYHREATEQRPDAQAGYWSCQ